MINNWNIYQLF